MSAFVVEGYPEGLPNAKPMRLRIEQGSATDEEVRDLLQSIGGLASVLMDGRPILWAKAGKARCIGCARTKDHLLSEGHWRECPHATRA